MSLYDNPSNQKQLGFRVCLAALLLYGVYLPLSGYRELYYDANNHYWQATLQFLDQEGRFNLLAFHSSLRGYFWPLVLFPVHVVGYLLHVQPITMTKALGAVTAALVFGWAVPETWRALLACKSISGPRRCLLVLLGFLFWRDHFNFPLTDFPALLLLLTSLWLGLIRRSSLHWMFLAGACSMAAANMRPVYLSSLVVMAVGGAVIVLRRSGWRTLAQPAGAFALGAALVSTPQLLINQRHYNQSTPLVLAWLNPELPRSLYLQQLAWGLAVQKYETSVGSDFPSARMIYDDPAGMRVLNKHGVSLASGFDTYRQYLSVVLAQAPELVPLYGRHAFNGLDIRYSTPYVRQVFDSSRLLSLLNYSVLFVALRLIWHQRRHQLRARQALLLATLLVPCLLAMPTAIECRFFLPLHLLLYAVVCFAWPTKSRPLFLRWQIGAVYAVFLVVCLLLSANTIWHLTNGPRPALP